MGTQITLLSGARLRVKPDGGYEFDPNGDFNHLATGETGTFEFVYTITDNQGATATATATITVIGVNEAPSLVNLEVAATALTGQTTVLTGRVLDPDSA